MEDSLPSKTGKVYLVGAGPGDAALITLRGVDCLRRAEVVLYDYLVNPLIVEHAPDDAEKICLGQHGRTRIWDQTEINEYMAGEARRGKTVVRLKGGDPAVFARGADETEYLNEHGVEWEMVPGITAALAAGSYAEIPITHRDCASAVAFVTGQEQTEKTGSKLDYDALARFPGTLVVYMGVTTARAWTGALIGAGKPPETPAVILRRCSFPDQRSIRCTLGDVAEQLTPYSKFPPPVIVIVGEVARLGPARSWFEKRPLFGARVMVTRPRQQMDSLSQPLAALGADVIRQPAIAIGEPDDWGPVDSAIERLGDFDWLVFSSANGVRYFLERLHWLGRDLRVLGTVQLAAIGPGTADELAGYRLLTDLQPPEYRAEALAEALASHAAERRYLLIRASRGREVLAEQLRQAGAVVEQVVAYQSTDVTSADDAVIDKLSNGQIDWVTVTSSAIARSLAGLFGEQLRNCRLASISPVTSETLKELGFEPAVEAKPYTMDGVVQAIVNAADRSGRSASQ